MTILINLLGQPSSGKTSLSAKLFARLKSMNLNAEYVSEYVKSWAWDGRDISPFDQFYFFGKEAHNQSHLFNKVDFIISDSPVLLTAFYHMYYNKDNALREICKDFYEMAEKLYGVKTLNFFLPRKKRYSTKGRYQTQEQADEIAVLLKSWLTVECYPFEELTCADEERVNVIIEKLSEMTNNFEGMTE